MNHAGKVLLESGADVSTMAAMGKRDSNSTVRKHSQADPFRDLTWDNLQEWAGPTIVSRGQRYQRSRLVQDLARTSRGSLIA